MNPSMGDFELVQLLYALFFCFNFPPAEERECWFV